MQIVAAGASAPAPAGRVHTTDDFNPRFTFDQFVIGDANRLAHAAALAREPSDERATHPRPAPTGHDDRLAFQSAHG